MRFFHVSGCMLIECFVSTGKITQYMLLRDHLELFRGLDMNFTDDRNVLPYRTYSYTLSVCNSAGCTESSTVSTACHFLCISTSNVFFKLKITQLKQKKCCCIIVKNIVLHFFYWLIDFVHALLDQVTVATAQGIPEDIFAPVVAVVNATSISVTVQSPGQPNGQVQLYTVLVSNLTQTYSVSSPQTVLITGEWENILVRWYQSSTFWMSAWSLFYIRYFLHEYWFIPTLCDIS